MVDDKKFVKCDGAYFYNTAKNALTKQELLTTHGKLRSGRSPVWLENRQRID